MGESPVTVTGPSRSARGIVRFTDRPHSHERRGGVRGGHIEIDAALPEGDEVVVLTRSNEEPFELDDAKLDELERRMAEARRGEAELAEAVLGKLRRMCSWRRTS